MFMSRLRSGAATVTAVALAVAAFTFLSASPAFAHEQRTVGAHQLTVGWETEPSYTGQVNAVELFVHDAKGSPLDDLGPTGLKVQVVFGAQTSDPMAMAGGFDPDTGLGLHGQFLAPIVPSAPGDYTFHFTGDINGEKIDQKFSSGPNTFNSVTDPTVVEFPAKTPTLSALATGVNQLTPRVDAVRSDADAATSAAKSAKNSAGRATTLAIVALVLGAVLGGAGLSVGLLGRRRGAS
jgi:hypothetical protein